jgi:hypothetical protein
MPRMFNQMKKMPSGLADEENQCEGVQSEDQLIIHAICSKSIQGLNSNNMLGQEAKNLSVSSNIRINQQESDQLVFASQTLPVTKSGAERIPKWDVNGVNKTGIKAQVQEECQILVGLFLGQKLTVRFPRVNCQQIILILPGRTDYLKKTM